MTNVPWQDLTKPLHGKPKKESSRAKYKVGDQVRHWKLLDYEIRKIGNRSRGFYLAQCVCGTLRWVRASNLTNGYTRSCGCKCATQYKGDAEGNLETVWR